MDQWAVLESQYGKIFAELKWVFSIQTTQVATCFLGHFTRALQVSYSLLHGEVLPNLLIYCSLLPFTSYPFPSMHQSTLHRVSRVKFLSPLTIP